MGSSSSSNSSIYSWVRGIFLERAGGRLFGYHDIFQRKNGAFSGPGWLTAVFPTVSPAFAQELKITFTNAVNRWPISGHPGFGLFRFQYEACDRSHAPPHAFDGGNGVRRSPKMNDRVAIWADGSQVSNRVNLVGAHVSSDHRPPDSSSAARYPDRKVAGLDSQPQRLMESHSITKW